MGDVKHPPNIKTHGRLEFDLIYRFDILVVAFGGVRSITAFKL
jgi:hypothetical protein